MPSSWTRSSGPGNGQVTYTNGTERVTFDTASGLPLLYEAGSPVGARWVYHLESPGTPGATAAVPPPLGAAPGPLGSSIGRLRLGAKAAEVRALLGAPTVETITHGQGGRRPRRPCPRPGCPRFRPCALHPTSTPYRGSSARPGGPPARRRQCVASYPGLPYPFVRSGARPVISEAALPMRSACSLPKRIMFASRSLPAWRLASPFSGSR